MDSYIHFEIFPNRIEITSPGRFLGIVEPRRPLNIRHYVRDPRITRVCVNLEHTRGLGEGIVWLLTKTYEHGLVSPYYFQPPSSVILILSTQGAPPEEIHSRLTRNAIAILDMLRQMGGPLSAGALTELVGVARIVVIRALVQLGKLGLVIREDSAKQDPHTT